MINGLFHIAILLTVAALAAAGRQWRARDLACQRALEEQIQNCMTMIAAFSERLEERERKAAPRAPGSPESHTPATDQEFLERVHAMIEDHLDDDQFTVEDLARGLSRDSTYVRRKLRSLIGESPSHLIRSVRLRHAAELIRFGDATVTEIAYAVGFKSVSHFSNAFLQQHGERPSAFAARHRGLTVSGSA